VRPALPENDENQILRVGDAELLKKGREQARHVIAGGVQREAKMAIEARHFHRSDRTPDN